MADRKIKTEVPLEAAVKYIVNERDLYKGKLEQLIPYTKRIEAELKILKEEKIDAFDEGASVYEKEIKRLNDKYERKEKECAKLTEELVTMRRSYKETQWYQDFKNTTKKLRDNIREMKILNSRLLYQNNILRIENENLRKRADADNDSE